MISNRPVIGIDVAKDFCFYAAASPSGTPFLKPFKALNSKQGLLSALGQIKKVEETFNSKPVISLESTGHYSARIVHFFLKQGFEVFLINPLISHSIKNSVVRKVKTDSVDAFELAKLLFMQDFKPTYIPSDVLANLKILTRTRFQIANQRTTLLNQLVAAIEQVAPSFPKVLNPASLTALTLLTTFTSPSEWLKEANQQPIISMLETLPRKGKNYGKKKYEALLDCASDAEVTGIDLAANITAVQFYANGMLFIDHQLKALDDQIDAVAMQIPEFILLKSIPGIGAILASLILGEIGDVNRFTNAKQLVAYCGMDPSVRQSGNYVGTKNRVTKRGSPFLRRSLYMVATTSIRKNPKGSLVNAVIYDYYQKKIQSKTKKQALGAVMNKLLRIIFSVLKNKKAFHVITPNEQVLLHQESRKKAA
jgi:transposase